jgi:ArsR family metal-binding transcriptional regulator
VLINKYDLDLFTPPCEPGAERFSAVARLVTDIREVLPYLNATLRGAAYSAAAPSLVWTKAGHRVAFHPYQIAISNVQDREAAIHELEELVKLVNRTWERRAETEPKFEERHRAAPMEVYKRLPQTNCKACGQPTCFVFAAKLTLGQVGLPACPVLQDPQYADRLAQLQDMLGEELPAVGRRERKEAPLRLYAASDKCSGCRPL